MKVVALLTSFKGRIGRGVFALASLGLLVASLIAFSIVGFPVPELSLPRCPPHDFLVPTPKCAVTPRVGLVFTLPQLLVILVFWFFHWATYVKRWHDLGRNGCWASGMSIVLFVGNLGGGLFLMSVLAAEPLLGRMLIMPVLGACMYSLWMGLVMPLFFAGSHRDNEFGPPDQPFCSAKIPGTTEGPWLPPLARASIRGAHGSPVASAPNAARSTQQVTVRAQSGGAQHRPAKPQFGRR